ncbi:unnamed protein product [Paramecium sonneborni]|uniref:VWFA domain-containing protein n=1 Tax=Paramecium sonneborni TaxID=65129 RepID=A0A8S1P1I1_9CILI|nr:unnamed protein product [Paramecium sonneborni]
MVLNTHYILILDDSGSMKGQNWTNAKNGALKCIKSIMNQTLAKISVIIFNQDARIVVECQKPVLQEISRKIQYKGGNTQFEPPFQKALTLIEKYQNFDKIQILFYTDGHAGYPENIINQFNLLPVEIRQIINLVACSGETISNSLALIIEKFQTHMQNAELRNAVLPVDLSTVWTEVVSQNFHNQLV